MTPLSNPNPNPNPQVMRTHQKDVCNNRLWVQNAREAVPVKQYTRQKSHMFVLSVELNLAARIN